MMGASKAAGFYRQAAMWAGSKGAKAASDVATWTARNYDIVGSGATAAKRYHMGPSMSQAMAGKSIYNRGSRRIMWAGGGVTGAMVLNASRAPTSGNEGLMPNSMGGSTGGY